MRFWAYNFKNKEVRAMKCLPLKSALNFDQDSKNKTLWLDNLNSQKMNGIRISDEFKPIYDYKKTLGLSKTQNFGTVDHKFLSSIFKNKFYTDFLWK